MRRIEQRVTGWPNGECVRATYAMLLGLPIARVPRLDPGALAGRDQAKAERDWLSTLGLGLFEIAAEPELPRAVRACVPPVFHLISGVSERGYRHRCVGYAGEVAIDPHPSQAGLETVYSVALVVPLQMLVAQRAA